jgi:hypothetical protein
MRIILSICTALSLVMPVAGLPADGSGQHPADPAQKLTRYTSHSAPPKVYLHLNKNHYRAGEVIWFNSYLLNSVTHLPDTSATNIYIDLISSEGVLMGKRVLRSENGVAPGDMTLSSNLPDGNYIMRGYTEQSGNWSEDNFFSRWLYISNDRYENIIPRSGVRTNKRFNRELDLKKRHHEVIFYPEGGELIQGVNNRVAFKAVDGLGQGLEAGGSLFDERGNELLEFSTIHSGMGSFEFQPAPGSNYYAMVSFNGSRQQRFELPYSGVNGIALRAERDGENVLLKLKSGLSPGTPGFPEKINVIGHTRGNVRYNELVDFSGGVADLLIPENVFEPGISQIVVFAENNTPLAQRLLYIHGDDGFYFTPVVFKTDYEGEEYLGIEIRITDKAGDPVEGNFSLSILGGDFEPPGSGENILSNVLITSDLKGIVEDPRFYLDRDSGGAELDHLMMTGDWRRFSWKNILDGELPELHPPSPGLSVRGRVTDPARNHPVRNHQVRMVVPDHNARYTASTDGRGLFSFDNLTYEDYFRVVIGGPRLAGDYPPDIELFTDDVTGHTYTPNVYTMSANITQRGSDWKRVSEAGRSPYAVSTDPGRKSGQFGTPDQTIFIDREKETYNSVHRLLVARATGLQSYGNALMFRGPTSINLSNEPMYMIDGVQTSREAALNMNPRDVERIEIFKGTSAAIFGIRGGSGVIVIYQRRAGDPGLQDSREYRIVGYHSPREFYPDWLTKLTGGHQAGSEQGGRALYWEPGLFYGQDQDNTVLLPLSDDTRKLKIIIEGVSPAGGIGAGVFTVEIRE